MADITQVDNEQGKGEALYLGFDKVNLAIVALNTAVTKLATIESGAAADQTGAEVKALLEALVDKLSIETGVKETADKKVLTSNERDKLAGIEASATADQTGPEIVTLLEALAGAAQLSLGKIKDTAAYKKLTTARQTAIDNFLANYYVDGTRKLSGDLNFDSHYFTNLQYRVVRSVSLVVAASNAPAQVKAQADYVCDGVDDDVQIQSALDIVDRVVITEGEFKTTSTITMNNANHLVGQGKGEVTKIVAQLNIGSVIDIPTGNNRVHVENMQIQGPAEANMVGISLDGPNWVVLRDLNFNYLDVGIYTKDNDGNTTVFENCSMSNFRTAGMYINGCNQLYIYNLHVASGTRESHYGVVFAPMGGDSAYQVHNLKFYGGWFLKLENIFRWTDSAVQGLNISFFGTGFEGFDYLFSVEADQVGNLYVNCYGIIVFGNGVPIAIMHGTGLSEISGRFQFFNSTWIGTVDGAFVFNDNTVYLKHTCWGDQKTATGFGTVTNAVPNELKNLIAHEIQQLETLGDTITVIEGQWGYLGALTTHPLGADGTAGRIPRGIYLKIEDGTNANTLKCTVISTWNGDAIGLTNNIPKGGGAGNFSLSADGKTLTIEASGLTGNAVFAMGNVTVNNGVTEVIARPRAESNDIVIKLRTPINHADQDITDLVDAGYIYVDLYYITDA